jgi:hypothetical protein
VVGAVADRHDARRSGRHQAPEQRLVPPDDDLGILDGRFGQPLRDLPPERPAADEPGEVLERKAGILAAQDAG